MPPSKQWVDSSFMQLHHCSTTYQLLLVSILFKDNIGLVGLGIGALAGALIQLL